MSLELPQEEFKEILAKRSFFEVFLDIDCLRRDRKEWFRRIRLKRKVPEKSIKENLGKYYQILFSSAQAELCILGETVGIFSTKLSHDKKMRILSYALLAGLEIEKLETSILEKTYQVLLEVGLFRNNLNLPEYEEDKKIALNYVLKVLEEGASFRKGSQISAS